jgi:hypothetical protein
MSGLRVTAAHELFHAIQIGSYGIWNSSPNFDFYFYELSSVWMEDAVFTWINDYYYDVVSYFRSFRDSQGRSFSFTTYLGPSMYGYERSVWAHFLAKRFSRDALREIWERMKTEPFLRSASHVIRQHGSTFESEFALFSKWNFFTADRADTLRFYPEGRHYPRFAANATLSFNGMTATVATAGYPLSTQQYHFVLPGDTITAVVANIETDDGRIAFATPKSFAINLTSGGAQPPFQKLSKGYAANFSSDDVNAWSMMYIESSTRTNASSAADPSPNPFRLSKDPRLTLPLSARASGTASLYLLSSSLDLVFSRQYPVVESFGKNLVWVPAADIGSSVSTGVYFIVARCNDAEYTWKIAIIQ